MTNNKSAIKVRPITEPLAIGRIARLIMVGVLLFRVQLDRETVEFTPHSSDARAAAMGQILPPSLPENPDTQAAALRGIADVQINPNGACGGAALM